MEEIRGPHPPWAFAPFWVVELKAIKRDKPSVHARTPKPRCHQLEPMDLINRDISLSLLIPLSDYNDAGDRGRVDLFLSLIFGRHAALMATYIHLS